MKHILFALIFYVSSTFTSGLAVAQEIKIGLGEQGPTSLQEKIPGRGQTQDQVLAEYGEPEAKHGPTGSPPIETWHYDYFSVYFENDYVIHSVIKHVRQDGN